MVSDFIIHVDESDFQYEVLEYSTRVPVVVDFWATWCIPCRVLGPKLEVLAREAEGRFRLAKLNVDENPRLSKQFKVRSIPNVKAFVDGHVISEFSGVLSDENLRGFVKRLAPEPEDLLFEKGMNLIVLGAYSEAEDAFREFLSTKNDHPGALLGLIRALLFQGRGHEANVLLSNFPASSEYVTAQLLKPVAQAFSKADISLTVSDNILDAAYRNSIRLAKRGNILAAMDGLLDILRKNRHYREDQVKDIFVGLLALIGESHPDARQYRNDLSSVLF
mgnify:CR=1 FL=1